MSFDPRSLERLKELGRRLPQPLPLPTPKPELSAMGPGEAPPSPPASGATGWRSRPTLRRCSTS
ncbi:hypothetical protein [Cyanobium sp. ATX-6F1]|uniref:hypothetical protein n=1 Tax=Cyanobium sp. ATX-6F1 TaxID=3137388 RepID=UPI0039BDF799